MTPRHGFIDFWRCDSTVCGGLWTGQGSREAKKCVRCGTPMPEWAKEGHATDPRAKVGDR